MLGQGIADPNGPGFALGVQLLERQPKLLALLALQPVRRGDEEQIHESVLSGINFLDALHRADMSLALAEAWIADLGRDKQVLARQAALLQRLFPLGLVVLNLRRVDVSVSGSYGTEACIGAVGSVNLIDAGPETGHLAV